MVGVVQLFEKFKLHALPTIARTVDHSNFRALRTLSPYRIQEEPREQNTSHPFAVWNRFPLDPIGPERRLKLIAMQNINFTAGQPSHARPLQQKPTSCSKPPPAPNHLPSTGRAGRWFGAGGGLELVLPHHPPLSPQENPKHKMHKMNCRAQGSMHLPSITQIALLEFYLTSARPTRLLDR